MGLAERLAEVLRRRLEIVVINSALSGGVTSRTPRRGRVISNVSEIGEVIVRGFYLGYLGKICYQKIMLVL